MEDILILVDEKDNFQGYMGKEEAHIKGIKHRAFSIFVFNDKKELLLQQRALHKISHTRSLGQYLLQSSKIWRNHRQCGSPKTSGRDGI